MDFLEINDSGDTLEINDSGDQLLILDTDIVIGGSSGGRVKKHIGRSLVDEQLGKRPQVHVSGRSESILRHNILSRSKGTLAWNLRANSESPLRWLPTSKSVSSILYKTRMESTAWLKRMSMATSKATLNLENHIAPVVKKYEKLEARIERMSKLMKLQSLLNMLDDEPNTMMEFSFNEADFTAFTGSSSFVGNVRYDNDSGKMIVILNGKEYSFCNVPRRVYDAFKGAGSKGAFFNRQIKGLYDC